jgi:hypothetical protein
LEDIISLDPSKVYKIASLDSKSGDTSTFTENCEERELKIKTVRNKQIFFIVQI